jgi:hypothetical protein
MPKLCPTTFSPAVAKAGGNMNSDAEESHLSPSSDDASSHDHVNELKKALDRNTEESEDDSGCYEGIMGNFAKEEDTGGDDLFQKSNNSTLSARKSEF